ncbi:GTP-binding protein [Actinomyces howellii]|uniref:Cobalamin synthesis protein cobW C-terminal domain n=1 Tax=Actinomyces howellii TaxID=52771 RepID=A0A448HFQ5_9ACTO|nr:GTP-binding protein [Actinomyces howellii]VEG27306.1 Cobalamin synthesis protein cobW C-terminal domain [Actinomyces howellii]
MHCLALVGAVDPALLELTALSFHGEGVLVLSASLRPEEGLHGTIRLSAAQDVGEPAEAVDVERTTSCWTCSLREVLVAVAEDRAEAEPDGATVVLLPPGIELVHLVPGLARDLEEVSGAALAGVAHVIDVDAAAADLLDHRLLAEVHGSLADDGRCTGEVHAVALGYADLVVALGNDPVGRDLIEHLRPHDTLLLPGLETPVLHELLAVVHDPVLALSRVHPATTQAWGGPHDSGVRTLDLFSQMPFHPARLRELVADLAGRGLLARGCFWLPSRPGRVCAWEVAGGVVSVGDAGPWSEVPRPGRHRLPPEEAGERALVAHDGTSGAGGESVDWCQPHCHLVVTGIADEETCARVREAFGEILLRPEEMVEALAWAGAPDGLEDWFGQD